MMKRILLSIGLLILSCLATEAQTVPPGFNYGDIPSAGQWASAWGSKQDVLNYVPLNSAGGTMSGPLVTTAPNTGAAGLNLPAGIAPTSPIDGDFWHTSLGFYGQVGGVTVGPFGAGSSIETVVSGTGLSGGSCTGPSCTIGLSTPVAVGNGGTGVSSLGALSTAMGLGTMSAQNAGAVAVSGGTITGMPNPTLSGDVANKAYVDATAAGLSPLPVSTLATATALPANTYNNGTSGVGATLTENANGALTVDGIAVSAANVIVVKNESTAANNGIYTVTQTGDGSNPYILTRATYFDQSSEMVKNAYTNVSTGSANAGSSWILSAAVATVGTNAVTFTQFSSSPTASLASANLFVGNGAGAAQARALSGDCTISNVGAISCTKTGGVAFATSATTDATNAGNIATGTLPAARLPNPSSSTLGGVQSAASVSHQWINAISTAGVPALSQPSFSDLNGTAGATQGGTAQTSYATGDTLYASGANTLSKLSAGSTGTLLQMSGGLPTWGPVYQTGTWTPVLQFGGASVGVTYSAQAGTYTKIGRLITATGEFTLSSKGSSTGTALIAGLPFAANASFDYSGAIGAILNMSSFTSPSVIVPANSSKVDVFSLSTGAFATNSNFTNTTELWFTITYEASS